MTEVYITNKFPQATEVLGQFLACDNQKYTSNFFKKNPREPSKSSEGIYFIVSGAGSDQPPLLHRNVLVFYFFLGSGRVGLAAYADLVTCEHMSHCITPKLSFFAQTLAS